MEYFNYKKLTFAQLNLYLKCLTSSLNFLFSPFHVLTFILECIWRTFRRCTGLRQFNQQSPLSVIRIMFLRERQKNPKTTKKQQQPRAEYTTLPTRTASGGQTTSFWNVGTKTWVENWELLLCDIQAKVVYRRNKHVFFFKSVKSKRPWLSDGNSRETMALLARNWLCLNKITEGSCTVLSLNLLTFGSYPRASMENMLMELKWQRKKKKTDLKGVNSSFVCFYIQHPRIKPLTLFLIEWKIVSLCELMRVQKHTWPPFICALTCRERRGCDSVRWWQRLNRTLY